MISIIIGGSLDDPDFRHWLKKIEKVKTLGGMERGSLAEYASRCRESIRILEIRDYFGREQNKVVANDPIAIHFPLTTGNWVPRLYSFIELAMDHGLMIRVIAYKTRREDYLGLLKRAWPELSLEGVK